MSKRYISSSTVVSLALALAHFGCEQDINHENHPLNDGIEASGGSLSNGGNRTLSGPVPTNVTNDQGTQDSTGVSQNQTATGGTSGQSDGTSAVGGGNTRVIVTQSSGGGFGLGTRDTVEAGGTTGHGSSVAKCRPAPTCPEGWIVYDDAMCPFAKVITCTKNGDGLCYEPCKTDSDCKSTVFSKCGSITMFHHSDAGGPVSVCVSLDTVPACNP